MIALQFPSREFAGYIFDCDGTLVESMPIHFQAWSQTLTRWGAPEHFTEAIFYSWAGMPPRAIVERLNREFGATLDPERVAAEKEERFLELLDGVQPIEPVAQFARDVAQRRPVSVVSGGCKTVVSRTLRLVGMLDLFPILVTSEDYVRGKPDPEGFLLAARLMGVDPADCLVLEDSPLGIQAARSAGMDSLLVPQPPDRPGAPLSTRVG